MNARLAVVLAAAVSLLLAVPAGGSSAPTAPAHKCPKGKKHQILKNEKHRCITVRKKPKPPVQVQLLAVNDFHGNLEPPTGSSGRVTTAIASDGTPVQVEVGGAEYLSTHVNSLVASARATRCASSSGDMIGASPLLSGLFHDEPTIEAMNAMGFAYNGVGNHEFDEGVRSCCACSTAAATRWTAARTAIRSRARSSSTSAANVFTDAAGNRPLFPPYEVRTVGGVKVGFIGADARDHADDRHAGGRRGSAVRRRGTGDQPLRGPAPKPGRAGDRRAPPRGRPAGAAPTQTINTCNEPLRSDHRRSRRRSNDEIDVVLSAHTHQAYNCRSTASSSRVRRPSAASSPGVNLSINRTTDQVVGARRRRTSPVTRDVARDAAITAILDKYNRIAGPIRDRVVGRVTSDLTRTTNAAGESSLGDVIADAQLEATAPDRHRRRRHRLHEPGRYPRGAALLRHRRAARLRAR